MDWRVIRLLAYSVVVFLSLATAGVLLQIRTAFARIFGLFLVSVALNAGVWGFMLLIGAKVGGWWEVAATVNTVLQAGSVAVLYWMIMVVYQKENDHGRPHS